MSCLSRREPSFCEWLEDVLDRQRSPENAYWVDRKERVFAVRWLHASSAAWKPECGELFKLWKTECSRSRGKPNLVFVHRDMKTNFRMNLRSEKFIEVTEKSNRKGKDAVRCYKIVESPRKDQKLSHCDSFKSKRRTKHSSLTASTSMSFPSKDFRGICLNHQKETRTTLPRTTANKITEDVTKPRYINYQGSCQYDQPRVTTPYGFHPQDVYTPQSFIPSRSHYNDPTNTTGELPSWTNFNTSKSQQHQNTTTYKSQGDFPCTTEDSIMKPCTTGDTFPDFDLLGNIWECSNHQRVKQEGFPFSDNYSADIFLGNFTPGDFKPGNFTPGDFTPGDFTLGDFIPGDFTPGDFSLGNFIPGDFIPEDLYSENQTVLGLLNDGGMGYEMSRVPKSSSESESRGRPSSSSLSLSNDEGFYESCGEQDWL